MCGFWHELPVLALLLRLILNSSCQATDDRTIFFTRVLQFFNRLKSPLQKRTRLLPRLDELVAGQSPVSSTFRWLRTLTICSVVSK